ncbi:MAG: hypothetical protein ABIZ49_05755 [Opitutaceae bacterium]
MIPAPKNRQPWPMKWIVLAIVVVIVPYTYLTLRYRKPGPAFRPYEDMQKRANVARLLSAGYQRIPLPAQRPTDPTLPIVSASIATVTGGLPAELRSTLVQMPLLPRSITQVAAAPATNVDMAYTFRFACTLPDRKRQLAGADLYLKEDEIVVVPDYEKTFGELLERVSDNVVQLTIPPGALKPNRYRVTLVGEQSSSTWTLEAK